MGSQSKIVGFGQAPPGPSSLGERAGFAFVLGLAFGLFYLTLNPPGHTYEEEN